MKQLTVTCVSKFCTVDPRTPQHGPLVLSVVFVLPELLVLIVLAWRHKSRLWNWGLVRICRSVESVAKYKMLAVSMRGCDLAMTLDCFRILITTAITVLQRNNAREILVLKIVRFSKTYALQWSKQTNGKFK